MFSGYWDFTCGLWTVFFLRGGGVTKKPRLVTSRGRGQNSGKSGYMVYVRPLEENSTIKMHENCRRKHNGNALLRKQHQCQRWMNETSFLDLFPAQSTVLQGSQFAGKFLTSYAWSVISWIQRARLLFYFYEKHYFKDLWIQIATKTFLYQITYVHMKRNKFLVA